ncbi:MAG: pseudouridine synthase [bacterium]
MRLDNFLATYGQVSRRKARELTIAGNVQVNGEVVNEPGITINPDKDTIILNGKTIKPEKDFIYIALNKPKGYVTTTVDSHGEKTVLDLLSKELTTKYRLFPVGRLDKFSEGLVLITNDGELTNKITHPRYEVEKEYIVTIKGKVDKNLPAKLIKGIELDDGISKFDNILIIKSDKTTTTLKILMHEGKKHQIRRMLGAVNLPVLRLKRVRIGNLVMENLIPSKYTILKTKPQ